MTVPNWFAVRELAAQALPASHCRWQLRNHQGETTDSGYSTLLIRICVRPQRTEQAKNIKYSKKMRANLLIWKRTTQTGGREESGWRGEKWVREWRSGWVGCAFFSSPFHFISANISGSVENGKYMFHEAWGEGEREESFTSTPNEKSGKCWPRLQRMKMCFAVD